MEITSILKSKLLRNSFFNSFSWGGNVLMNLVAIPIIVHYLGVEGFGIYALLTGLFGYFGLLDLGLGQGITKYVAHYRGIDDKISLIQSVNAALRVQTVVGGIGLSILCWFNRDIVQLLNVSKHFFDEASLSLYVAAIGFFVTMLMGTFSSTLAGLQRYDIIGKTSIVFSALTTIAILGTLLFGGGLLEVITASLLVTLLNCFVLIVFVFRAIAGFQIARHVHWSHMRLLFSFSSFVFVFKLSNILNTYFVRFVIGLFLGPQAVAYYVVPFKLVSGLQSGLGSIVTVLFPFTSELSATGRSADLKSVFVRSSRYHYALSTPLFLFLFFFSHEILQLWMGGDFAKASSVVMPLLAIASLLAVWTMIPVNVTLGLGYSSVVAGFSAVVAAVNVVFVLALTAAYGIVGTAAAVLLTALQAPVLIWYVTSKLVQVPWNQYWRVVLSRHAIPLVLFVGAAFYSNEVLGFIGAASNEASLTLGGILIVIYYFLFFADSRANLASGKALIDRLLGVARK